MRLRRTIGYPAVAVGALLSAPAHAQAPNALQLGRFGEWGLYAARETCFVAAKPWRTDSSVARDSVFLFITTRPRDGIFNEVSVRSGYAHDVGRNLDIRANGETFRLFTNENGAWVKEVGEEARLVRAMRNASGIVVVGVAKSGTTTTDTYSIDGLGGALDAMAHDCAELPLSPEAAGRRESARRARARAVTR